MVGITAALVASVALAAPVTVAQTRSSESVSVAPAPTGGAWVVAERGRGEHLAHITEAGAITSVPLPPKLRGADLDVMPLSDGWTVATDRFWPGGAREEERCTTPPYGAPIRRTHCGVLVVAQYSPKGRWTATQRLAHSSGGGTGGAEPAAVASGGRIELAWFANQEEPEFPPVAVAVARPGSRFGPVHIARRVLGVREERTLLETFRGQLYLRVTESYASSFRRIVERRLFGDGRLGRPHFARNELLATYAPEALRGPRGSEILVAQPGTTVAVARRRGWGSEYEPIKVITRTALAGFQVAESGNDYVLVSVRSSPKPLTTGEKTSIVAAIIPPQGALGPTQTVEYDPLNTGQYSWSGAIDAAGQALIASSDYANQTETVNQVWLHPSAPDCSGFTDRVSLTGTDRVPTMFTGPGDVFHLLWTEPNGTIMTATARVSCSAVQ